MKKTIWIIVMIVVLVFIVIGFSRGNNNQISGEPIKIGSIAALSGIGVAIGEEELKGAQLAVQEINKEGGVSGRPLQLISEDLSIDKLDMSGVVASKLINIDKVVAIVGPQWDEPAMAILPITEQNKMPVVGPDTTDSIETNGLGTYLFSTWYDNRVGIDVLLKFAQDKGWKNITVMRLLDAGFWKFASDEFTRKAPLYGVTIIDDINIGNPLTTDFRTFIAKAKQKNPEAVFFVTSDPNECVFLRQMKEIGLAVPLLATEAAGNGASLSGCPDDMANLYFSTPSVHHEGYTKFEDSFVKVFGRKPLFPSAVTAYDAVRVIAAALEKTNGEGGEALQKALSETKDFPGASLPLITFKSNGFVITPDDAFEVQTIKDGKFVRVEN